MLSCLLMRCTRSKTSAPQAKKILKKIWLGSTEHTRIPSQWLRKTEVLLTSFQSSGNIFLIFWTSSINWQEDALRVAAQAIIEPFKYAKTPPHMRSTMSQAHLENGNHEEIVSQLEVELELNVLEAPDGMQMNNETQHATKHNPKKPKPIRHHCKKTKPLSCTMPSTQKRERPRWKQQKDSRQ